MVGVLVYIARLVELSGLRGVTEKKVPKWLSLFFFCLSPQQQIAVESVTTIVGKCRIMSQKTNAVLFVESPKCNHTSS